MGIWITLAMIAIIYSFAICDLSRRLFNAGTSIKFLEADIRVLEKVIASHQSQINAILVSQ